MSRFCSATFINRKKLLQEVRGEGGGEQVRACPFFDPVGQVACTLKSMSIPRSIPFFWRITRVQVKQPQCAPVSTIMLPRGARGSRGPPRALSTQRPPPHSRVTSRSFRFGRDSPQISRQTPHRRTRQACLGRQARGRAQPTTAMTPTRHPPHARTVTLLSPRAASTTSSAPPLHHPSAPRRLHFSATAPRGKHACESTHTSIANAPCLSVCALF